MRRPAFDAHRETTFATITIPPRRSALSVMSRVAPAPFVGQAVDGHVDERANLCSKVPAMGIERVDLVALPRAIPVMK
jgi:hypothetical protein